MKDFTVTYHGSICLLTPLTDEAQQWVEDNLPEDRMHYGAAIVVEPRYIDAIVEGMIEDGLEVA